MSNILTARVQIEGTRALLWHHFGPDAIPLEKQEKSGVSGNDPSEWRRTVLVTNDGQLYIKPTYAFGCIREAAKYTKKGRGSLMSLIAATLQVTDEMILIDRHFPNYPNGQDFDLTTVAPPPNDITAPVFLDVCGVRNPTTKGRNVRYRVGASKGWHANINLLWDKTIIDRNQMHAILIDAGNLVGVGDGRSVGYGRFTVEHFEIGE